MAPRALRGRPRLITGLTVAWVVLLGVMPQAAGAKPKHPPATTTTLATTTTTVQTTTTTTTAPTTTTTTPLPPAGVTLWRAGMETGTTLEWSADSGGGLFNSGTFEALATTTHARSGSYSLRSTIFTPPESGVRAFRWAEPRANRSLYYSVWMFIPTNYTLTADPNYGQYWNLFQFKSRSADGSRNDPLWALSAAPNPSGGLYLRAGWGWGGTTVAGPRVTDGVGGKWYEPTTRASLPVGRWFHLEAYLHQSNGFDGELTVWQDGVKTFNLTGVRTSYANCNFNAWCANNEWSVNNYSDGLSPNPATVYIDDAAIGTGYIS